MNFFNGFSNFVSFCANSKVAPLKVKEVQKIDKRKVKEKVVFNDASVDSLLGYVSMISFLCTCQDLR